MCNFPSKCRAWNFIGLPANCSSKASATAACSSSTNCHALAYSRLRPMHAYASNITVWCRMLAAEPLRHGLQTDDSGTCFDIYFWLQEGNELRLTQNPGTKLLIAIRTLGCNLCRWLLHFPPHPNTCAHTGTRIDTSSLDRFIVFNLRTKAESRKHQIDHAGVLTE